MKIEYAARLYANGTLNDVKDSKTEIMMREVVETAFSEVLGKSLEE